MRAFRWLIVFLAFTGNALAQEWPAKLVKFVVPYPPGGSVDPLARLFAGKLTDSLKQQFIVENRAGASGIIGTDYAAKSPPDGYTWLFIFDTHAVHQALHPKLPFDPLKDFAPVMIVSTAPLVITTGTMKPYQGFAEVLATAKAKPDTVTMGNASNGTLAHLTTMVLNQTAGIKLVPVAYKGAGPLVTEIMGGQVDLGMASIAAQAPHVKGGRMRALAQTGEKRSHLMPDVPTLKEEGINIVVHTWWGILAPAGTPKPIIDKLVVELNSVIRLPDVNRTLTETLGMDVVALNPPATQKWIEDNVARWGRVVRENSIRAD
jgi:tripartite-type tricarboxylate transporter receptor subunit TctC